MQNEAEPRKLARASAPRNLACSATLQRWSASAWRHRC